MDPKLQRIAIAYTPQQQGVENVVHPRSDYIYTAMPTSLKYMLDDDGNIIEPSESEGEIPTIYVYEAEVYYKQFSKLAYDDSQDETKPLFEKDTVTEDYRAGTKIVLVSASPIDETAVQCVNRGTYFEALAAGDQKGDADLGETSQYSITYAEVDDGAPAFQLYDFADPPSYEHKEEDHVLLRSVGGSVKILRYVPISALLSDDYGGHKGYPFGKEYPFGIAIEGDRVRCYGGYYYWGGLAQTGYATSWITIRGNGDWLALNLMSGSIEYWAAADGIPEDKPEGTSNAGIWRGLFRFNLIDTGEIDDSGWDPVPLMRAELDKIGWLPSDIAVMRPREEW